MPNFVKETPEAFLLPSEASILKAAAGWAHCVSVTGNPLFSSLSRKYTSKMFKGWVFSEFECGGGVACYFCLSDLFLYRYGGTVYMGMERVRSAWKISS
jgi:hypothetical protein